MRVKLALGLALGFALWGVSSKECYADTIDFESTAIGTYSSLTFTDLTITFTGGNGDFQAASASPGSPISGIALISWFDNPGSDPWLVTFNSSTTSFSIGVGDYNADVDNTFMEAYDAAWNLLDTDTYVNPAATYGGGYLTVTGSAIKYVKFWDGDPFAGAVYWDNIEYGSTVVPVPPAALLGFVLMGGLGVIRKLRRRSQNA